MSTQVKSATTAPAVRPERVREVAQKLASGYYLTPEAAEKTAEAIQNSPD